MVTISVGDLKARFSDILKKIQLGEVVAIAFGRKKEILAYIVPKKSYNKFTPRPLGLLEGKASFQENGDFKLTEEEFLSI